MLHFKDASALVDALETQGLAHVLAEPSLTTTSGKCGQLSSPEASSPLPVVQPGGNAKRLITIEYKPFGVSLNFTPVVMSKEST